MNKSTGKQGDQGQVANQGNKQRETQDSKRKQGVEGGRLNDPISQSGSDRSNQQVQSGSDRHAQKPMPDGAFGREGGGSAPKRDMEDENKKIA